MFSGKQSKKVNGLYKLETSEIIIHNRNFSDDNGLMYTAIHEYAHHLVVVDSPTPPSTRSHTVQFWALFHTLLGEAERKALYVSGFDTNDEFAALTKEIKERCVFVSGTLMKDLGELLVKAHALCEKHHTSFFDYIDRVLNLPRTSAKTVMQAYNMDLDPRVGFENMRTLTRMPDPAKRVEAERALLDGMSPDSVTFEYGRKPDPPNPLDRLLAERTSTERQLRRLEKKLGELDRRIEQIKGERRSD